MATLKSAGLVLSSMETKRKMSGMRLPRVNEVFRFGMVWAVVSGCTAVSLSSEPWKQARLAAERDYVLAWEPPDTPMIGYLRILNNCNKILSDESISESTRQHALFCRGIARWCRWDDREALEDLRCALDLGNRGRSYQEIKYFYALVAATVDKDQDKERSAKIVEELMKSSSLRDVARAYAIRAIELGGKKQWMDALAATDQSLRRDPQFELAFVARAVTLANLGQPQRAREYMEKVRRRTVETDRVIVERLRVGILLECGRPEEAVVVARRAAAYFVDRAVLWAFLSEQERSLGHPAAARYAGLLAYTLNPEHDFAKAKMVEYLLDIGDVKKAAELTSTLVKKEDLKDLNEWGMLTLRIGLGDRQAIDRAIARIGPANMNKDLLWRAVLYLSAYPDDRVRDGRLALEVTKRLPPLHPKSKHYALCRAIEAAAHAECGEWEAAMAAIDDAGKHARDEKEKQKLKELHRLFSNKTPYRLDPSKGTNQPLFLSFFVSVHEPNN